MHHYSHSELSSLDHGLKVPDVTNTNPLFLVVLVCVEEAKALAHQFNEVCATMFPVAEMANTVAQHHEFHQQNSLFREHRQHDIHAAL